jgi:acetoin utilization deacetylase AcuC-like enzyme
MMGEENGRKFLNSLFDEPRCDLNLHLLSHVEGDNIMDRFLIPAAFERGDLVFSALESVWKFSGAATTAFVAARPPGHHCPSFEDRLVGLSVSNGVDSSTRQRQPPEDPSVLTKLEKQICIANGLCAPPKECGMGFCALNALAVAVKTFQRHHNPNFELMHGRSIRIAIVDLDIHAGNGTELVFRDNRSVLHVSLHRYGWLKSDSLLATTRSVYERVMPGTHPYKDVGGIYGKDCKNPRGEGYSINVTLRKADGNAEVCSAFEAVVLPVMQEFCPDVVLVACGFDGLKLSPAFKQRWGEESCPGMDAEYTPSLYGYLIARIRNEVQEKVVAVTEGGYDPIGVCLSARCVVK